jgi:hypothetical protein
MNKKSRVTSIIASGLMLSACVATSEQLTTVYASQRPATADQKAKIIAKIKDTFFDPYSIRDAEISNALPFGAIGSANASAVCIHLNSKNRMGGYVGRQYTMMKFNAAGVLHQADDTPIAARECADPRVVYQAFPEAEAL